MLIKLTYYKENGKYYSTGEYETRRDLLFEVWSEVRDMLEDGKLPGLVDGHSPFIISVDAPDHPHNHPHLIMPNGRERAICRNAVDTWGNASQMLMVVEEMSELQKAICKIFRGQGNLESVAEEIADVEVTALQLKMMFDLEEEVAKFKREKLAQLEKKIEKAKREGVKCEKDSTFWKKQSFRRGGRNV